MSVQWPADREHSWQDGVGIAGLLRTPNRVRVWTQRKEASNKKKQNSLRDPSAGLFFNPRRKKRFLKAMNNSNECCLASGRGG